MAHNGDGPQDLPATWPFRAAGTLLIAALIWFCLGFAIEDLALTLADGEPLSIIFKDAGWPSLAAEARDAKPQFL